MVHSQRDLTIREIRDGEEFAAWLAELTSQDPDQPYTALAERHLVLTNEVGDWIGGVRFTLRGGVAQLVDIGVVPGERGQGHGLRLLDAFEHRAGEAGAHLVEFWTDRLGLEPLLAALGWSVMVTRPDYIGGRTWYLLAKQIGPVPVGA
jgi:GNAT superfamily N-acetyltransferase